MAAKWTFMVYVAGFNNLSPFASKDLEEMREVGSTDDVNVAVFVKQLDRDSAERLIVQRDGQGESPEQLGDVDSGNPQTMLDFVRWAAQSAPAERYALVVWNHGSGWQPDDLEQIYSEVRAERGDTGVTGRELGVRASQQIDRSLFSSTVKEVLALPDAGERGIASDDGTGHSLDTIELSRVLESAHEGDLGQPFELLGMDACLMSTLEVSYEARAHTRKRRRLRGARARRRLALLAHPRGPGRQPGHGRREARPNRREALRRVLSQRREQMADHPVRGGQRRDRRFLG
jgi:hypothetical protein